jgi:hypothetical protein
MKQAEIESEIIKVVSSFQDKPTFNDLPKDARLISLAQEFEADEILEAGLFGNLYKVISIKKPDRHTAEESPTSVGAGYLFITNERLRFLSIASSWGTQRIEKKFNWGFHEVSSIACESRKVLWREIKVLRFSTNLGNLKLDGLYDNTRAEDFAHILQKKTSQPFTSPKSESSFIDELERLAKLKSQGVLSNEEFELAKAKLLR